MQSEDYSYKQGAAEVHVIISSGRIGSTFMTLVAYAFANGNEIVAQGVLNAEEYARMSTRNGTYSDEYVAQGVYDWLV